MLMTNVSSFFYFRSSRGRGGFSRGGFSKPVISSFDEPKTENGSFESPPQGKCFCMKVPTTIKGLFLKIKQNQGNKLVLKREL